MKVVFILFLLTLAKCEDLENEDYYVDYQTNGLMLIFFLFIFYTNLYKLLNSD